MDSVRDYSSIIHSPSFTFLVGPKHTKLTIQSGLAQHVSKPLHNLMNGHTRESKHRIAVLEEEDVETFVAFCEYAYTGDYSVPRPEPEPEEDPRTGVVESAPSTATWRESYRSGSVSSSTVPPPAPSPPPEHRHRGYGSVSGSAYQESQPDTLVPEPETSVPEPVSEPAPVEVNSEEPPGSAQPEPATEPVPEDDITAYEAEAAPEELPEDTPAEEFPEVTDEPVAVPVEEPAPWELEEPVVTKSSKKEKKKKKGKKGKSAYLEPEPPMDEDVPPCEPASLTPPSTPPTYAEPAPEPEPEEYPAEPEWPAEAEAEAEPPVEEDWPEPEEPAPEPEAPMEDSWTQNQTSSQTRQRPMLDMSFAQQQASSPCEPGLSLWDEFTSLQYNDESTPKPTSSPTLPYLTFHAKVYVFATRYLIPALAQLCLRKLHADLLTLPLETNSSLAAPRAQMVLDLVHYAYTKTARLEPISPTSATQLRENELRRLVVHYAACKVKELARYHVDESAAVTPSLRTVDQVERVNAPRSLRSLLDMTTELASDLVYRMM